MLDFPARVKSYGTENCSCLAGRNEENQGAILLSVLHNTNDGLQITVNGAKDGIVNVFLSDGEKISAEIKDNKLYIPCRDAYAVFFITGIML